MGGFKGGGGSTILTDLQVDGTTVTVNTSTNAVGIGTATPGTKLQVEGTAPYLTLKNDTSENSDGGCESKIIFEDHANVTLAQIQGSHDGSSDDTKGDLIFSTHDGSSLDEALRIDSAQLATFAAAATVTTNLTVGGDIILDDGGSLKEAGGTAAITFDGSGNVTKLKLAAAAVAVADDHIVILDGGATGAPKAESIQDLLSAIAGSGISVSGNQLVADGGGTADSVAADNISQGDGQIDIKTNSGTINIGHADNDEAINIGSTGTGAIQVGHSTTTSVTVDAVAVVVDSADTIDIDAADEITIDTTSADGHIAITSAHTAGQSILISANASDTAILDIDAGELDIDVQDQITIDTTSADGHIAITSAHTAGDSILISANANAGSILDIDAGIIDIDVQDTINIDAADEIEIATTSADGHITLTSAHTSGVAFHIDANADAASEVQIDAGVLDIDVTAGITIDGTTLSIDGTDDSNITVTASAKDLDIAVAGGGTQELRLASAGTGASALHLNASAGSVDIDSADAITVDAADEIVITTTSADGHISLVSAHTSGVAFHLDANADAASEVQIDAGILDVDVTAGATIDCTTLSIDSTDTTNLTMTANAAGTKTLTIAVANSHGSGVGNIDVDADGTIDIDAAGNLTMDATVGSITLGAALTDGQTLKLGKNGAVETIIAPHGTAGSELYSVINTSGDTDGADAAGAILLSAVAGGIGLAWADDKDLWAEGGQAVITANHNVSEAIKLHADAGANQTIQILNDEGTTDGTEGAGAIDIEATVGGISIHAADDKDIWVEGGQVVVTANHDAAGAIKLHADAGSSQTITIVNDAGTSASAIKIDAAAGSIDLDSANGTVVTSGPFCVGAAAGASGGATTIVNRVAGATDNTPTAMFTVTVPNAAHTAGIFLQLLGSTSDNESCIACQSIVSVSRNADAAAVAGVVNFGGSSVIATTASVIGSGEAVASMAVTTTAMSGATDAAQTFNILVQADSATGTTIDLVAKAELLNNESTGVTIAAA